MQTIKLLKLHEKESSRESLPKPEESNKKQQGRLLKMLSWKLNEQLLKLRQSELELRMLDKEPP